MRLNVLNVRGWRILMRFRSSCCSKHAHVQCSSIWFAQVVKLMPNRWIFATNNSYNPEELWHLVYFIVNSKPNSQWHFCVAFFFFRSFYLLDAIHIHTLCKHVVILESTQTKINHFLRLSFLKLPHVVHWLCDDGESFCSFHATPSACFTVSLFTVYVWACPCPMSICVSIYFYMYVHERRTCIVYMCKWASEKACLRSKNKTIYFLKFKRSVYIEGQF